MSATPPPFQVPSAPQARATNSANKTCLIIVLMVVGLIVAFCAFGAFMVKGLVSQVSTTASCAVMFELSQKSALAYAKEHNGVLPSAETWQDDIAPYYTRLYNKMSGEIKGTPIVEGFLPPGPGSDLQCKWENRVTGIAMNSEVGGKKIADIKNPKDTVLFFETDKVGKSLAMKYVEMPKSKAPKIMNEQRDWLVVKVEGTMDTLSSSSSSSKSFEVSVDDALTPKTDKAAPTPNEEK